MEICQICGLKLDLSNTKKSRGDSKRTVTCGKCYLKTRAKARQMKGLA
mgnify:CR=1 FL=1